MQTQITPLFQIVRSDVAPESGIVDGPVQLVRGLDVDAVERELERYVFATDVGRRGIAHYLAEISTRRLYLLRGYPSLKIYAKSRFGFEPRTTREYRTIGVRLSELPLIDEAFAAGRISWSKVRSIVRVAVESTQGDWIDAAVGYTQREIEALVRRSARGHLPPVPQHPEELLGTPGVMCPVRVELDSAEYAMFERVRAKLSAELDLSLTDREILVDMMEMVLSTDVDGSVPGRKKVSGSAYKVVVRVADGPSGTTGEVFTEDGPVPIDPELAEGLRQDAAVPRSIRHEVMVRDEFVCCSCGRERNLILHHVVHRAAGGSNAASNLATLCVRCHSLAHAGLLRVWVEGGAVRVERGRAHEAAPWRRPGSRLDPPVGRG